MPVDPNVYALSIELSLDTSDAFKSLDDFGDKLTSIEKQIADMATSSMTSVSKQIDSFNTQLESSVSLTQSMADNFELVSKNMEAGFKLLTENSANLQLQNEGLQGLLASHDDLIKLIRTKNVAHEQEEQLIRQETEAVNTLGGSFDDIVGSLSEAHDMLLKYFQRLTKVLNSVAEAVKLQEEFVTNNYRMYGSMSDMAVAVHDITVEYSLLGDEATNAYKALAELRTPSDEIEKYTGLVGEMHRVTGATIPTLAEYSRRLRAVGGDSNSTELSFNRIQAAMTKFGASADDVNKILAETGDNAIIIRNLFGEGAVEDFARLQVQMSGIAKSLGNNETEVRKFFASMTSDISVMARIQQITGMQIKTIDDLSDAYIRVGAVASYQYNEINRLSAAGVIPHAVATARIEALAKQIGMSVEALDMAVKLGTRYNEELERTGSQDAALKFVQEYQKSLNEQFESTQEFYRSLQELYANVKAMFGNLGTLVARFLNPIAQWLGWFIGLVSTAVGWVTKFYMWLRETKYLGVFIQGVEQAVGILAALYITLQTVLVILGVTTSAVGMLSSVLPLLGKSITATANYITVAMAKISAGIAAGMRMVVTAIKGAYFEIIALGVALAAAGAGAYLFARAVAVLMAYDWQDYTKGIAALTIGMIVLGGAIVGLGIAAEFSALGILVVTGVLLAMALASDVLAKSVKVISESFGEMDASAAILAATLPLATIGIGAFGLAAMMAVVPIAALGLAMWGVGRNTKIFADSIVAINDAFGDLKINATSAVTTMSDFASDVKDVAESLKSSAGSMSESVHGFGYATGIMLMQSPLLIMAGKAIMVGVKIVSAASESMSNSFAKLIDSASSFNAISNLMYSASITFQRAVDVLATIPKNIVSVYTDIAQSADYISSAGDKLTVAVMKLQRSSSLIQSSSVAIRIGLWILRTSLDNFAKTGPMIERVSGAISSLSTALDSLSTIPLQNLHDAAIKSMKTAPVLTAFADQLPIVASKIASGVQLLREPVQDLINLFNDLNGSVDSFGSSMNLVKNISGIMESLEKKKAEVVVAGTNKVVRTEETRQVRTTEVEGADRVVTANDRQLEVLRSIDTKFGGMPTNKEELMQIVDLLKKMVSPQREFGLESNMNNWS